MVTRQHSPPQDLILEGLQPARYFYLFLSMVVKVKDVERPDSPSRVASSSQQKEALDPLSRNAYVSTIRSLSGASILTGTSAELITAEQLLSLSST